MGYQKRWTYQEALDPDLVQQLSDTINVNSVLSSILVQRGVTDFEGAKAFFRPNLNMLHDPFLMKNMDLAVQRVLHAMENQEKILVYGDYDVDGTTSVAMVFSFLKTVYPEVDHYIPDRYKEGYGISRDGIDLAVREGFSLVIALDCGIKAVDLITEAKEQGVDFIVCDHHLPGEALPPAVAVLDPKQPHCSYPYKDLSGCGVGFKLIQALVKARPEWEAEPFSLLDFVVVSIASDIVPITGENRVLAYHGLQKLAEDPHPGLKALMRSAGLKKKIDIAGIVFGIAPRINAAGRIDHARTAVELMLAEKEEEAYALAENVDQKNSVRKDFDTGITEEALAMIEEDEKLKTAKSTVLYKQDWHKGVIGIVASRCIEKYHRPTIILTTSNDRVTGSARSVPGYDIYGAIAACGELLENFGGHRYAAGLTLSPDNVKDFQSKFEQVVATTIPERLLIPQINVDATVEFDRITPNFFKILKQMAPFGPGNMPLVFVAKGVRARGELKYIHNKHVKFVASQNANEKKFEAIAFNSEHFFSRLEACNSFSMAFTIEENEYRGYTSLQLNIKDLRFEELE